MISYANDTSGPWITVIGIGDDGLDGLAPSVRTLIAGAELLVGGDRHHAMVAGTPAQRLTWEGGLRSTAETIAGWRGHRVVVLATGDPMWFGGGANLAWMFGPQDMTVVPHPGAFSLAAARMLWPLADVDCVSVHGRPFETLNLHIQSRARLLVLSRDGDSPARAARLLTERGFGPSDITVLEHLGGPEERRYDGIAQTWDYPRSADLNTLAIRCRAGPRPRLLPRVPGLPDEVFENDGQLTKREVRAATIAALAPQPGQLLWDVGAGSGSIGIEWLRSVPAWRAADCAEARAVAIERDANRCAAIARNAAALGVPQLEIVQAAAPDAFESIDGVPDSIFVGGGAASSGLLQLCWDRLAAGGRLVVNTVSLEASSQLLAFRRQHGGEFIRIAVARAAPIGELTGLRAAMEVTQYTGEKW